MGKRRNAGNGQAVAGPDSGPVFDSLESLGYQSAVFHGRSVAMGKAALTLWPALAQDGAAADTDGWERVTAGFRKAFDAKRSAEGATLYIVRQDDGSYREAKADEAGAEAVTAASIAGIKGKAGWGAVRSTSPTKAALLVRVRQAFEDAVAGYKRTLLENVAKAIAEAKTVAEGGKRKAGTRQVKDVFTAGYDAMAAWAGRVTRAAEGAKVSKSEAAALRKAADAFKAAVRAVEKARDEAANMAAETPAA